MGWGFLEYKPGQRIIPTWSYCPWRSSSHDLLLTEFSRFSRKVDRVNQWKFCIKKHSQQLGMVQSPIKRIYLEHQQCLQVWVLLQYVKWQFLSLNKTANCISKRDLSCIQYFFLKVDGIKLLIFWLGFLYLYSRTKFADCFNFLYCLF